MTIVHPESDGEQGSSVFVMRPSGHAEIVFPSPIGARRFTRFVILLVPALPYSDNFGHTMDAWQHWNRRPFKAAGSVYHTCGRGAE